MPGVHRRFKGKFSREFLNCCWLDTQHFSAQPGVQFGPYRITLNAAESLQPFSLQVLVKGNCSRKLLSRQLVYSSTGNVRASS